MRRRLFFGFLSILLAVVTLLLLLLNFVGLLNFFDGDMQEPLEQRLTYMSDQVSRNMEQLAANAIDFSEEMSAELSRTELPFDRLRNDPDALYALQESAYDTVYSQMRLAPCSGAFYILNATVNTQTERPFYDGIYLKYSNVGSDADVFGSVCMYRGNAKVARKNDIRLYSTWQYETESGTFPEVEGGLFLTDANPAKDYYLTVPYKLPDAWERARFLCAPILDASGRVVGVCGFEISDLFFQLSYQTSDSEQKTMLAALLTESAGGYEAQLSGCRSAYVPRLETPLSVQSDGDLFEISGEGMAFLGKTETVAVGNSSHIVAAMLPEGDYLAQVHSRQTSVVILLSLLFVLAVVASFYLSKYSVRPFREAKERLKSEPPGTVTTRIPEIDDLFVFLAQKDREREEELSTYHRQNADLHSEVEQLREAHEKAKTRLAHMVDETKQQLDPDNYALFARSLRTLTLREREVFDLYIEGKNSKEIMALLGIGANGLKFHNRNIYSKLGISSKKELLRYAAVLASEKETALSSDRQAESPYP